MMPKIIGPFGNFCTSVARKTALKALSANSSTDMLRGGSGCGFNSGIVSSSLLFERDKRSLRVLGEEIVIAMQTSIKGMKMCKIQPKIYRYENPEVCSNKCECILELTLLPHVEIKAHRQQSSEIPFISSFS
jgi:hypothetical protein